MSNETTPWKKTACIFCSLNCGLEVQLEDRQIAKVRGDKEHPESQGYMCEKSRRLNYYQNAADRIQSPLRRRPDGSYQEVSWETAIEEIASRFEDIKQRYGGEKILFYGGGGQGNHLGGTYGNSTLKALGVKYRSNALAQEKTGEFWVQGKMMGAGVHGDFEHTDLAVFLGKNPWQSHGFPRSRIVMKEIAQDPKRAMIVIDPRRSESAAMADLHLQVKPGTDAWCLAAIVAILLQRELIDYDFVAERTDGFEIVAPLFGEIDIDQFAKHCQVPKEQLEEAAERIAGAKSVAFYEDLGVQMNRHSTLNSYLQRLAWILTGNFAIEGGTNAFVPFLSLSAASKGEPQGGGARGRVRKARRSPVTKSKIIIGLIPCNVIPEEILTDHPDRFRAMLIESGNPVHSLADSPKMREAMEELEFSVVIDVAMTETARCADYVLPAASQFEKAECTFFNTEFPKNTFQVREALFSPLEGTLPEAEIHSRLVSRLVGIKERHLKPLRLAAKAGSPALGAAIAALLVRHRDWFDHVPVLLYRALGPQLPKGLAEAAVIWALSHLYARNEPQACAGAGYTGPSILAGEKLFQDILSNRSGVVFAATDNYQDSWQRVRSGRIQLALPELFSELIRLSYEGPEEDAEYPFILSAGERRSETTNTIVRDPQARPKKKGMALRISPDDAETLKVKTGDTVQLSTRRGSAKVGIEVSKMMRSGHISLPNGFGLEYAGLDKKDKTPHGVSTNELTRSEDRDPIAGTPWHKTVPAKLKVIAE